MLRILKKGTDKPKSLLAYNFPLTESKLNTLIDSPLLEEGVYSLELFNGESVLVAPSLYREGESVEVPYFPKFRVSHYRITLDKPSFLPLYINESSSLFKQIAAIDESVHVQLVFQKLKDNHKKQFIEQYKSYLEGNDLPFSSSLIRSFQTNAIKVLSKVANYNMKREYIPEIELKILEKGYKFEIKVAILSEKTDIFEEKLQKIIKNMDFYNELSFERIDYHENMRQREFSQYANGQILCESELKCMLLGEYKAEVKPLIQDAIENSLEEVSSERTSTNFIDMLPVGVKKERPFDDATIGKRLLQSIKRVGLKNNTKFKIVSVQQGATLQKITVKLPEGVNYTEIKKKTEDLQNAFGTDSFSIEHGEEPETISILVPCNERDTVHLKELMMTKEFEEFSKKAQLPFIIGVDPVGNLICVDLAEIVHLLVAGQTGGGKSKFLNQLILTILIVMNPKEIMMYLIDPKKVEFKQFGSFPQVQKVITDMSEAAIVFASLELEMESRYEKMAKAGYKKISEYNKKAKNKIPYIVVVVDEYADLFHQHPEVEGYIQTFGGKARAAGIHMIIATQYPLADVVSSIIKENLPSQISFRLKSNTSYKTVFGSGIPYTLLGKGDGVARIEGQQKEFMRFQSPVITVDDTKEVQVCEEIAKLFSEERLEGIGLVKQEKPIDQLKRIIASNKETRIKELQQELGIRINVVSELMRCLVDEGWLEKEEGKKGYSIVASDEELDKWR
ncbi:FtsK/SpoIIIE domain-containing protein [Fictibacillus nanhaiensis]|uniref:FtsK/SpoIIIE domain-containing protein n=1 Tax=Fictibacillus nanhaiensis TaxID=742169 RepID=UPI002E2050E4|nr:FtsK/SpoIIIE domain-containing protein [Fictibacillus nanhaiensis]MED1863260.1 FtsK/SpoIIIE domain-containing protein [Fictibacillus nanhaiensis]